LFNFVFNNSHFGIDWGNVVAVIMSGFIGAFGAIYVGNKNNETQRELNEKQINIQRELWSKDAYIKYEAEVITECKKIYDEVFQYIWQFESFFISRFAFVVTKDKLKKEFDKNNCYEYYIKPFNKLNHIFLKNKQIFAKYGLDKAFQGLNLYIYLLTSTKPIKEIIYSPCNETIKDLNNNCDIPAYRADFWYMFPFLINHLLNGGGIILNAHCTNYKSQVTNDMIEIYEDVIFYYKDRIEEMDDIFNKIMLVGEVNEKILPSYINEYSLGYYKEYKKGQQK